MVMSLLSIFKRKKKPHTFTDEERELSLAKRKLKADVNAMQMEVEKARHELKLAKIQDELDSYTEEEEDDGMNIEKMMMMLMMNKLGAQQPTQDVTLQAPEEAAAIELSDEQITEFLKVLPKVQLKLAKVLSDEQLSVLIQQKAPIQLSPETISRVITAIRS